MGDPVTLVESATPPVVTAIPTVIAGEMQDGAKTQSANKNGKKADSGSSSGSFFTWFIVLALLGVWTSVAVVYFDLVDYQGVLGKLVAYDTDGDGDFDVEDAKVLLAEQTGVHEERKRRSRELPVPRFWRRERKKAGTRGTKILAGMRAASLGLDETPGDAARRGAKKETPIKDVGSKLREALKQQLAIIHERVEAKKLAKLALAEVREILAKEEEAKELELGRKEISAKVKERVATRLKAEEEKIEKEEMEKALEKLRKEKAKPLDEKEGKDEKEGEKKSKKGEKDDKSEKKMEGEGKKAQEEDNGRGKESAKEKRKKSDRGGKN